MPDLDYLRVLKWVLIVLLAGFIGQFGKSFAKHLMEKVKTRKKGPSPQTEAAPSVAAREPVERKAVIQEPHPPAVSPEETAKQEKKVAKALAKQKKKAAKALEKQMKP